MEKTLTVLVPFYNEERTIPELVAQLKQLPNGTVKQLIFVNDGSTDGSVELLEKSISKTKLSYHIINKENGGKASAIKTGSKFLTTTHVVILDADLELSTSDISKLWAKVLEDESDHIFGYRKFLAHSSFTWRYSRGNQIISNIY